MRFESTNVYANIHPRLQRLIQLRQRGLTTPPTASTVEGEVSVIAKVNNLEAWHSMNEVREGAILGNTADGNYVVTARVPVSRLQAIRTSPSVMSLEASVRMQMTLSNTTFDAQSNSVPLDVDAQGQGVIVGIIDVGCDFAHKNFRHADGSTRILSLWDQDGHPRPDSPFGYGRVYSATQINQALQSDDPYATLEYYPEGGAHGTHVMDIAAGNGIGTGRPGRAPAADIVFVNFSKGAVEAVLQNGGWAVEKSLGDTTELVEAIGYIFDIAGNRPCVVNVSLALHGGPHDGTALVEQSIDAMVASRPNRAVVIAAGNSYGQGIHAAGTVPQDGYVDLEWDIPRGHSQHKAMEVWYSGEDEFILEIIPPEGENMIMYLGENGEVVDSEDNTMIYLAHRANDPNNGDNMIGIFMEADIPRGVWKLRLHGHRVTNGQFHAWIEREDGSQTRFGSPYDEFCTVNSIGCGHKTIMVGSFNARKANQPLSYFSTCGPTRDGRQKPDFIAPGQDIWGACALTGTESIRKSGTSMSAPDISGAIALLLGVAQARNLQLDIDQIRDILAKSNQTHPPSDPSDRARYGFGPIDIKVAISAILAM